MNKRNQSPYRRKVVRKAGIAASAKRKLRWLPNTLTLCNSWCGFASILWSLSVYESATDIYDVVLISSLIILGAMVFDVLDGFAARMLNATSMIGLQMDSLADMVTFGVAPAVLMVVSTHWLQGVQTTWGVRVTYLLCAIYVGGAALRLATYNVKAMEHTGDSNIFHGLPSPGAAAAIVSVLLAMRACNLDLKNWVMVLPVYAAVLGILMVSPLPYRHLGKWLLTRKNNQPVKIMILIVLLFAVAIFREYAIFTVITLYVLSGPVEALQRLLVKNSNRK